MASTPEKDPLKSLGSEKYDPETPDVDGAEFPHESKYFEEAEDDGTYGGRKAYAEQALPAEYDPAVPKPGKTASEEMYEAVAYAKNNPENLIFIKEQFFRVPAPSKRKTLTELHNLRDLGDAETYHDSTAEDIAVEILHRASILHLHPELVVPFADVLKSVNREDGKTPTKTKTKR